MSTKMLGILLDDSIWNNIPSGRTRYEKIRFYERAGKKYGLVLCFFRLKDIDLKRKKVRAYVKSGGTYRIRSLPIPKIIHNRAMPFKRAARIKLRMLSRRGYRIYNRKTRYGKLYIHRRLKQNPRIRPYLPATAAANLKSVAAFMKRYRSLILKPDSSSVGLGIMKLEKRGQYWVLHYPRSRFRSNWGKIRFARTLPPYLVRKIRTRRYLVQQTVPLATIAGRPFDMRVSVQRNGSGKWQITGIVGKVAARGNFLTNVAQGGRIFRMNTLFRHHPGLDKNFVIHELEQLSLNVAHQLSRSIPGLADLGLDIGISRHGKPFFIECNARDLRYSFQKGKLGKEWRKTYENPVAYADYLLQTSSLRKDDKTKGTGNVEKKDKNGTYSDLSLSSEYGRTNTEYEGERTGHELNLYREDSCQGPWSET